MGFTDGALRLLSDYMIKAAQDRPDHIAFLYGSSGSPTGICPAG